MAVDFSRNWSDEIADVTESNEYQTCEIRIDWDPNVLDVYDYSTATTYQVEIEVNSLALELIRTQAIIDDPNSTPGEVDDAENDFSVAAIALLELLDIEDAPDIEVSNTSPDPIDGDLWIQPIDRFGVVHIASEGGWNVVPVNSTVYSGQARFIPVRAGVWQGGEAQLNATTIRAVRFQLPRSARSTRIHAGAIVTITDAPFNKNLKGRTAKVDDDFQGSSTATRTFHAMMDADSEDD